MQENFHSLTIERQKSLSATGVESVSAFSETQIVLVLTGGNGGAGEKLYVTGTALKITGFSKTSGTFTATGNITGARYGGKSLRSRIFR